MYSLLFLISLAYFGYVVYHTMKGTLPVWFDKRLFKLKTDESYKDIDNKRWDSPIGALSKVFSLSILFTSYIVLTYLIGWSSISKSNTLYVTVFFAAIVITYFMHSNFSRRLNFYRHYNQE
jgi:hypothetical protein